MGTQGRWSCACTGTAPDRMVSEAWLSCGSPTEPSISPQSRQHRLALGLAREQASLALDAKPLPEPAPPCLFRHLGQESARVVVGSGT